MDEGWKIEESRIVDFQNPSRDDSFRAGKPREVCHYPKRPKAVVQQGRPAAGRLSRSR